MRLPISAVDIVRNRSRLKKELIEQENLIPTRIAILGGSTTTEVRSMLELFLLAQGIQPAFYESGYGRYFEDVLFENPDLWKFKPEIVFIHTTWRNVAEYPVLLENDSEIEGRVRYELGRVESLWDKIRAEMGAVIIQNNFDLPGLRPLGNLEASQAFGRVNFLLRLNAEFGSYALRHSRFLISDILYLSAQVGLDAWFDYGYWYRFHMAVSPTGTAALAKNVAGIIKSLYGRS